MSKGRTSVTSSCISEKDNEEVRVRSGKKKKLNGDRKSDPLATAGEKKGKFNRRTKSDVTKKKKKFVYFV